MRLLETLAWEVATFRHLPDEAVTQKPVVWLFAEYERVAEARWRGTTEQIAATQTGVGRALAQAFGKGDLPDLPDYDEIVESSKPLEDRLPAWHKAFEQANEGRRIQWVQRGAVQPSPEVAA